MTTKEAVIAVPEDLKELDLDERDHVVAKYRDGKIVLTVTVDEPRKKLSGKEFVKKWKGKFADLKDMDLSDDPRAEYILNH